MSQDSIYNLLKKKGGWVSLSEIIQNMSKKDRTNRQTVGHNLIDLFRNKDIERKMVIKKIKDKKKRRFQMRRVYIYRIKRFKIKGIKRK